MVEHKRPRWCSVMLHTVSKSHQIAGPSLMLWPITEWGLTLFYQLTAWLGLFNSESSLFLCCHLFAMEANAAGFVCKSFQLRGPMIDVGTLCISGAEQKKPSFPLPNNASLTMLHQPSMDLDNKTCSVVFYIHRSDILTKAVYISGWKTKESESCP